MSEFDPRFIVKKEFYALLRSLENLPDARVYTERPYKITLNVHPKNVDTILELSLERTLHSVVDMLSNVHFRIKEIKVGLTVFSIYIVPDWSYWQEQKVKLHSDHLEMDDIIPI